MRPQLLTSVQPAFPGPKAFQTCLGVCALVDAPQEIDDKINVAFPLTFDLSGANLRSNVD